VTLRGDLLVHLARFARTLRGRGVDIGIGDEIDATTALTLVDLGDRDEIHRAFRAAFKIRPRDRAVFDEQFDAFWTASRPRTRANPLLAAPRLAGGGPSRSDGTRAPETGVNHDAPSNHSAGMPGYSPDSVLRRKPFDECSADDLTAIERLLARLARKLATRRSRRLVSSHRRETADLRRSLRRAIGTGGELVSLAWRARAVELPRLVVLCDTSGSMDRHARFLLAFVVALKRVARSTELFVFNTSLIRITPAVASGRMARTIARLSASVPDWSGGTKIGESLNQFVVSHLDRFVTKKTVVIVFSDGLDRGDTTLVAAAMRAIRSRAEKVIWLNPLAGDSRYEPTARAMAAARPFIDRLAPAHNLESLERLLPELTA
jgi:uncharacterized protein with von Willebrand factor type A (vWA) domain